MTQLEKILNKKNISKLQLALDCKITPSDLYSAIRGKKPFYPKWKEKILNYLNVNENLIFNGEKLKEGKNNGKNNNKRNNNNRSK